MRFVGSAIWRTETVSPGPGLAPELAVRADIEIPDRRMTVTWSLRRNTDKALPASHVIEIKFKIPADFPGGGIANVPGVLMKDTEQARGTPLFGCNRHIHPRQMTRQRAAIDATLFRARLCGYRVLLVIVGFALGNRLFDILERQKQLVGIELLRAFSEVRAAQLAKQMAQPIDLRKRAVAFSYRSVTLRKRRHHQRTECFDVVGKNIDRHDDTESDSC